jgi:HAD superfamily hydrolase (TIGR01490 family)
VGIAFFDLDRTLISRNSGGLWVRSELREGFITNWQAFRAAIWLTRYRLGLADLEDALRSAISTLEGDSEQEIRARTHRFYKDQVRALYRPGAQKALSFHRRAGDSLVLLSSTSPYMGEAVAEELQLDDVLCNQFEVDPAGHFTGKPMGELCYGAGKLTHGTRYAETHGVDLDHCTFYTDSTTDLPMLEAVGRPVVVHPDPRLENTARNRGWEIADWGTP